MTSEAHHPQLDGQVAIVPGESRGIGKAISLAFTGAGAHLVLVARTEPDLADVSQEIARRYPDSQTLTLQADVSNEEDVQRMVDRTIERFGRVDILVNNAGVWAFKPILETTVADWDRMMDVNLRGVFLCSKAVLVPMMRQRSGRVINMASVIGLIGNAGQANYAASKAGLIALTKSAAKELGSRNILINAIAPGFIDTEMTQVLGDEVKKAILKSIPLGILGKTVDVAKTALFLASDESNFITGQVITVDGGMVM